MKEQELDKFCKILGIHGILNQSIDQTIANLKAYLKEFSADPKISEKYQELKKKFEKEPLEGKRKEEQRDVLLKELIPLQYDYYIENAAKIMNRKANALGKNVVHIEEVNEFKKTLEAYYRTYKEEVDSVEEILQRPMHIFMKKQEDMGQMITKGVPTIERLKQQQFHNIINSRKKNFSGEPYRWAANLREIETKERLKSLCLMNEPNEKGERVVAMRLGLFEYDRLMRKPSAQFPTGQYGEIRRKGYCGCGEIGCE